MTLANGSQNDVARRRREIVAHLRVRGMTEREIAEALAKPGANQILNPLNGQPYTRQTIHSDIALLRRKWQANAAQNTNKHQARQLAEIQEIKRQAFLDRDGLLALRAIDREMKLLGTAVPERIEIKVNIEVVTRAWEAIEKAGRNPVDVFNRLAQEAERVQ
jgi:hypothetical protein